MCLQLNAKHFEPRLHPRNKLYIEREFSKLEKFIHKELRDYSAEVVQVVHKSAEINVQQINDLNAFVDELAKFTLKREQELEQMLCTIERKLQDMMDSTDRETEENKRRMQDIFSQLDKLLSR